MDPQVVEHDDDFLTLALLLEAYQEVFKVICVIVLIDNMIVDQPLLLADGTDDCDRVPTVIHHLKFHPRADPAASHLLPKVEGGLIQIEDLIVGLLNDHGAKLLHELHLISLQLVLLGQALPVLVVWSLELHPILDIVVPKSL